MMSSHGFLDNHDVVCRGGEAEEEEEEEEGEEAGDDNSRAAAAITYMYVETIRKYKRTDNR